MAPTAPKFSHSLQMLKLTLSHLFKSQVPVASLTHFVVKLSFAAPDSFLSAAALSHDAVASDAHLVMKLLSAAPASFFSSALCLQVCLAMAPVTPRLKINSARATCFISSSRVRDEAIVPRGEALREFCPSLWDGLLLRRESAPFALGVFSRPPLGSSYRQELCRLCEASASISRLCRHIRVTGRAAYFPKVLTSTEDVHRTNVIIVEILQASHQTSMYGRFLRVEGSYGLEAEFAIGARQTLPLLKPNPCRNLGRCPEEIRQ